MVGLDQENAFDRVEHCFLWNTVEKFGFSAGFTAKIKVLYSDIEGVLKINGSLCALSCSLPNRRASYNSTAELNLNAQMSSLRSI